MQFSGAGCKSLPAVMVATGHRARDPRKRLTRCDSLADSIVWMIGNWLSLFFQVAGCPHAYAWGFFIVQNGYALQTVTADLQHAGGLTSISLSGETYLMGVRHAGRAYSLTVCPAIQ